MNTRNTLKLYPVSKKLNKSRTYVFELSFDGQAPDIVWVENEPMHLTLTLIGLHRPARTARYIWQDTIGRIWPMFLVDMLELLQHKEVKKGVVNASWQVRRRSMNFGIALAVDELINHKESHGRDSNS